MAPAAREAPRSIPCQPHGRSRHRARWARFPQATPRAPHDVDLGHLPSIDLDTLAERGELLTRLDRKYLVDLAVVPQLVAALWSRADGTAALELGGRRQFGYESVYYDTPTLTSYLQAARQRPHRFKVRSRSYLDSGQSFLEVKTRDGRRRTVKSRIDRPRTGDRWGLALDPLEQSFVAGHLQGSVPAPEEVAWTLTPTLSTRYRRSTLFLPDDSARVTIDVDLQVLDRHGAGLVVPALAIIETKTSGRASAADRALWQLGQRPVTVSKYGTSLAALHPNLPATKWRPALRRIDATVTPRIAPGVLAQARPDHADAGTRPHPPLKTRAARRPYPAAARGRPTRTWSPRS